jgi:hypothetical protein
LSSPFRINVSGKFVAHEIGKYLANAAKSDGAASDSGAAAPD